MAAPIGNKNAEKWTLDESKKLFNDAIELTNKMETIQKVKGYSFDFIGDVARELNTFHHIFRHLVKRFPELNEYHKALLGRLETNCYYNGKRGFIKEASSIMNLKSNHQWTDRATFDGNLDLRKATADLFPEELDGE